MKMRKSVNENKTQNNSKHIIGLRCFIEQFKRVTKLVKSTYKYNKSTRDRV